MVIVSSFRADMRIDLNGTGQPQYAKNHPFPIPVQIAKFYYRSRQTKQNTDSPSKLFNIHSVYLVICKRINIFYPLQVSRK